MSLILWKILSPLRFTVPMTLMIWQYIPRPSAVRKPPAIFWRFYSLCPVPKWYRDVSWSWVKTPAYCFRTLMPISVSRSFFSLPIYSTFFSVLKFRMYVCFHRGCVRTDFMGVQEAFFDLPAYMGAGLPEFLAEAVYAAF